MKKFIIFATAVLTGSSAWAGLEKISLNEESMGILLLNAVASLTDEAFEKANQGIAVTCVQQVKKGDDIAIEYASENPKWNWKAETPFIGVNKQGYISLTGFKVVKKEDDNSLTITDLFKQLTMNVKKPDVDLEKAEKTANIVEFKAIKNGTETLTFTWRDKEGKTFYSERNGKDITYYEGKVNLVFNVVDAVKPGLAGLASIMAVGDKMDGIILGDINYEGKKPSNKKSGSDPDEIGRAHV
jgi:hypothetical protein